MKLCNYVLITISAIFISNLSSASIENSGLNDPIGTVQRENSITQLVLDKKYQNGLYGLENFSHIWVIWWFDHQQRRSVLQVNPREKKGHPKTGVFACRAPVRPNLIAMTLCKIESINNNIITIDTIDAFDNTPIIDIKPYISKTDSVDFQRGQFFRRK